MVTEDEPHRTVRVGANGATDWYRRHPGLPCHQRAIHSGLDRCLAVTHGQQHGGFHLCRSMSSQAAILPDLALQAGSQPEGESLLLGRAYLRTTVTSREAVSVTHSNSLHSWKNAWTKAGPLRKAFSPCAVTVTTTVWS